MASKRQTPVHNQFLSLAPYMRGWRSDSPSYAAAVEVGAVMVGGTIARVMLSDEAVFDVYDWVQQAFESKVQEPTQRRIESSETVVIRSSCLRLAGADR